MIALLSFSPALSLLCFTNSFYFLVLKVVVAELTSLRSNQEETDTRVVMYLHHAQKLGFKSAVVRTPDSDIFFILLIHAHDLTIYLDTGTGKHRSLINISELAAEFGKEWCSTLLGLYVFTGEDCTSAFKGKGKVTPLKLLQKNPKFHKAFRSLYIFHSFINLFVLFS